MFRLTVVKSIVRQGCLSLYYRTRYNVQGLRGHHNTLRHFNALQRIRDKRYWDIWKLQTCLFVEQIPPCTNGESVLTLP